jgi:hypothetical protein
MRPVRRQTRYKPAGLGVNIPEGNKGMKRNPHPRRGRRLTVPFGTGRMLLLVTEDVAKSVGDTGHLGNVE